MDPPTLEDVAALTFATSIPEKEVDFLRGVFRSLDKVGGEASGKYLLQKFKEKILLEELSVAAYDASLGKAGLQEIHSLFQKLEDKDSKEVFEYVTHDIHAILRDTIQTPGLRWRLPFLNESLGSLRKGNFGFIFARPETGKTTFLASEITYMAEQLKDSDGPIIWFNNEQDGKIVMLRIYQAALGAKEDQIIKYPDKAEEKFLALTKGKIYVRDDAAISRREIEAICKRENPSLIVFDQIDKIKGFAADREDLLLGDIYQWARELAKRFCPVIGVCQADATAEGVKWLNMSHVSNSKTTKQAEADFILGIGRTNDLGQEHCRYFCISKNKLSGDEDTKESLRHGRAEVLIDPLISRYLPLG